ncbi:hypothetical protein GCM10027271_18690 [Saccharopolyspora gloriosae]
MLSATPAQAASSSQRAAHRPYADGVRSPADVSGSGKPSVSKKTIKVKRKCCHSRPPCKKCPIVVLREALKDAKEHEVKKAQKKSKKDSKGKKSH